MVMTHAVCRGTGYTVFVSNHPSHGDLTSMVTLSCVIQGRVEREALLTELTHVQKVAPYLCSHDLIG